MIDSRTFCIHRRRRGVTFLEVSICSLLVGLLFVGAIRALASATQTGVRSQQRVQAAQLAHGLQAEICGLAYEDPNETAIFGMEPSESSATMREELDDVDDFHNWSESPIVDRGGNAVPSLLNWKRTVTVTFVDPADLTSSSASDEGMKRITVEVSQVTPPAVLAKSVGYQTRSWTTLHGKTGSTSTRQSGNRTPIAKISANKLYGIGSLTVNFQTAECFDPDGDTLTYSWNFGDGSASNSANPTHSFTNSLGVDRTYVVMLTVTDAHGASAVTSKSVVVVAN